MTSARLLVATTNPGKLAEVRAFLAPLGLDVRGPRELGMRFEVEETGTTFSENALLKARALHALAGGLVLADDSGLEVDALGGEPGVRSARYGGPGLTDAGRCRLLLDRLRDVPEARRTARFVCCIALVDSDGEDMLFTGTVDGVITREPRGHGGFGYDSVFLYPPEGRTFAQLDSGGKAAISHRGRALAAAQRTLRAYTCGDHN